MQFNTCYIGDWTNSSSAGYTPIAASGSGSLVPQQVPFSYPYGYGDTSSSRCPAPSWYNAREPQPIEHDTLPQWPATVNSLLILVISLKVTDVSL